MDVKLKTRATSRLAALSARIKALDEEMVAIIDDAAVKAKKAGKVAALKAAAQPHTTKLAEARAKCDAAQSLVDQVAAKPADTPDADVAHQNALARIKEAEALLPDTEAMESDIEAALAVEDVKSTPAPAPKTAAELLNSLDENGSAPAPASPPQPAPKTRAEAKAQQAETAPTVRSGRYNDRDNPVSLRQGLRNLREFIAAKAAEGTTRDPKKGDQS